MKVLLVTILLICLTGCADKDSDFSGKLSKEKMQQVMWDIIRADVYTEQFIKKKSGKDASTENMLLQNKIFALHNVTRTDFYKSYEYYSSHADEMKVILDSMTAKAERDRSKMMQERYSKQSK